MKAMNVNVFFIDLLVLYLHEIEVNQDGGLARKVSERQGQFSAYLALSDTNPEAAAFAFHGHITFTDERRLWILISFDDANLLTWRTLSRCVKFSRTTKALVREALADKIYGERLISIAVGLEFLVTRKPEFLAKLANDRRIPDGVVESLHEVGEGDSEAEKAFL